jgi:hypothetical protein
MPLEIDRKEGRYCRCVDKYDRVIGGSSPLVLGNPLEKPYWDLENLLEMLIS